MIIEESALKGLYLIQPKVFQDKRGYFFESFNQKAFNNAGLDLTFVQDNQSKSQKNVLRGLHFQLPPAAQGKLVQVIKGAVLDVAVDIRKESDTFGHYLCLELSEENKKMLYIPQGFAHGFLTLRDETIFSYKCTDFYNAQLEAAIRWNDPDLHIDWKVEDPIVSEKDQKAGAFAGFNSPF
ncbi:MAG: dTDP-4-dehydrorhamnose 3,5-epimerase [Vicingaceae bacterium]